MIEVYKILTDKYDNHVNLHLERQHDTPQGGLLIILQDTGQKDSITRGHSLKLVHPKCHYDLRK